MADITVPLKEAPANQKAGIKSRIRLFFFALFMAKFAFREAATSSSSKLSASALRLHAAGPPSDPTQPASHRTPDAFF